MRLRGYDYSTPGAYFVTICSWQRKCMFGEVVDDEVRPNEIGQAIAETWARLSQHYSSVELDEFIVMPNHIHGVILLKEPASDVAGDRAGLKPAPTPNQRRRHGLPEVVRGFKTFSARRINSLRGNPGAPVWQRNYYEHVVRNEEELNRIRQYVRDNPVKWSDDVDNPKNIAYSIDARIFRPASMSFVGAGFKPALGSRRSALPRNEGSTT